MCFVAGVDGCKAGWMVALAEIEGACIKTIEPRVCFRFPDVLRIVPQPAIITVDMPIGLLDEKVEGGRETDRAARRALGSPRASSVFSPPTRPMLSARSYEDVRPGLSKQAYGILPKIREVDETMTPDLQDRIVESHPELVFWSIARRSTRCKKSLREGHEERLGILRSLGTDTFPGLESFFDDNSKRFPRSVAALDDILDAYVLAWLALQISLGTAKQLPAHPPVDGRGLRMEMWHAL